MKKKYFYLLAILSFFNVHSQEIIHFTDPNLKEALIRPVYGHTIGLDGNPISLDANNDGEIDTIEALEAYSIQLHLYANVSSLTGMEYFTNLIHLLCSDNPITEINVRPLVNLKELILMYVPITTLDISQNTKLTELAIQHTQIISLDTSPLTELITLNFRFNSNFETLIMGDHPLFKHLIISRSNIREIDLNRYPTLESIGLEFNQLTSIDVSNLHNLKSLYCNSNQLTSLDASHSPHLETLYCANNPFLESINVKAGLLNSPNQLEMTLNDLPMLRYICADEQYIPQVETAIVNYGLTNCHVNSYCSFVPGGEVYRIEGKSHYQTDGTECGVNAVRYPNLKFSITDGTNIGMFFGTSTGYYKTAVQEGLHMITPLPEYDYFSVSPTTTTVGFPETLSPFEQNFCLTPNGTHNDLELVIIPFSDARPGFDADYKIIYANKGTTVQSGILSFEYNDEISDLITTSPVATTNTFGNINWNFTDLQPFESRAVTVKLNHNSPVESPALNEGDELQFTATFTDIVIDETPDNNTFQCSQTVVNSHDPNDKTCLEGNVVSPDMSGKYINYMIRFENTGTFAAENVVVKDIIDLSKFDITSLIPVSGSHSFITKISDNNKVEFIFENINLPFDDANNDGYVIFKIRTKSTLAVGDSFSNQANIYFDYNFPIITNNATTTIAILATTDFAFSDYFTFYPNPAGEKLNIKTNKDIKISSLSIYDISGRLIQSISNPEMVSGIDISTLKTGNYFIKINSDKGTTNAKFAKK